jgi:hypothetical protein
MKKLYPLLACLFFISGCASSGNFQHASLTQVNLREGNYTVIRPNATGASSGFNLFGIIPITAPQYTIAMSRLYENANIQPGEAYALANVVQEQTTSYFLLFSIPTYRVRADVVKFEHGEKEDAVQKETIPAADELGTE